MKHLIVYFRTLILLCLLTVLTACGGSGGDSTTETPTDTPNEPTAPVVAEPAVTQLSFENSKFTITWTHPLVTSSSDPVDISYTVYYAEEQIENDVDADGNPQEEDLSLDDLLARFDGLAGKQIVENAESPLPIDGVNDTTYYFVITATTADGTSDPLNELRATPRNYVADAVVPYNLNDTGYTNCGDFAYNVDVDRNGTFDAGVDIDNSNNHDNQIDCTGSDDDGDTIPAVAAQDASHGRDSQVGLVKVGSGVAGFDFTKLDSNGAPLAADAGSWSCVQDNYTGLIWEVKTTEGLHSAADRYSWYNTDILSHGGDAGFARATDFDSAQQSDTCFGYDENDAASFCNTQAFVERVNSAGLCGATDWRMPSREELVGIIEYLSENDDEQADPTQRPSVDTNFFPNTQVTQVTGDLDEVRYFSGSPLASNSESVWAVYFGAGGSPTLPKGQINAVRLVRTAP